MTDEPTKAAIERACELLNAELPKGTEFRCDVLNLKLSDAALAFAHFINHVSETVNAAFDAFGGVDGASDIRAALLPLILPDPEPDVLVEVVEDTMKSPGALNYEQIAHHVRERLTKRGYAITPIKDTSHDR